MRKLSLLFLIGALYSTPIYADTDDRTKIEKLELEIVELTKELNMVRMQYATLQTRLENVRSILGDHSIAEASNNKELDAQSCLVRLSELKQTQAKLKSLGYKNEHPDLRLVGMNIEKRTLECGMEGSGP